MKTMNGELVCFPDLKSISQPTVNLTSWPLHDSVLHSAWQTFSPSPSVS